MANVPDFRKGDPVDYLTSDGWTFCGIVKCINFEVASSVTYAWVKFIVVNLERDKRIPEHKHGAWYEIGNLRHAVNPPID